jgi:hypothetical protein
MSSEKEWRREKKKDPVHHEVERVQHASSGCRYRGFKILRCFNQARDIARIGNPTSDFTTSGSLVSATYQRITPEAGCGSDSDCNGIQELCAGIVVLSGRLVQEDTLHSQAFDC